MSLTTLPFTKRTERKRPRAKKNKKVVNVNTPENDRFLFGNLSLGHCETVLPRVIKDGKAWLTSENNRDYLNIDYNGEEHKILLVTHFELLHDALLCNKFNFSFMYTSDHGLLCIQVHFKTLPIEWGGNRFKSTLKKLINFFIPESCTEDVETTDHEEQGNADTIEEIYVKIRSMQARLGLLPNLGPLSASWQSSLKPTLRSYQLDAVKWMVKAEREMRNNILITHPCFTKYKLPNMEIYASIQVGSVYTEAPVVTNLQAGAILADEMGLGKTVEVLALILSQMNQNRLQLLSTGKQPKITMPQRRSQTQLPDQDDAVAEAAQHSESTKTRLKMLYDALVQSVYDKPKVVVPEVSCICGSVKSQDVCTCEKCGIKQHFRCVGYESASYGPFYCSFCWTKLPLVKSHGTLIVCPNALIRQWLDEIAKHVNCELEVLQYDGAQIAVPVYPTQLATYDIVITSYSVLQTEIYYMSQKKEKLLRGRRKYSSPGSAITRISWHRLCLDEAQMVESVTSHISQMAASITASCRWAITGTPMSIGLSDLYGILRYLDNSPLNDPTIFNYLAERYKNHSEDMLIQMLARMMWRTSKRSVLSEIKLPSNIIQYHGVEFTSVERFFYNCEAKETRTHFERLTLDLDMPLADFTKQQLRAALLPFDALRRVCVHFTTAKGRYMLAQKPVQTHEQLLLALIRRNFSDCEERVRSIIACHNGLAGIYLLLREQAQAVREYVEVGVMETHLRNTYGSQLVVDKLPLIHMCYNLKEVLGSASGALGMVLSEANVKPPSINELHFKQDMLEQDYVAKFQQRSRKALDALHETSLKLSAMLNAFTQSHDLSWCRQLLTYGSTCSQFQRKVQNICDQYPRDLRYAPDANYSSVVERWLENVNVSRLQTLGELLSLHTNAETNTLRFNSDILTFVSECHLRPDPNQSKSMRQECPFCVSQTHIADYSKTLYHSYCENVDKQFSKSSKPEELILRTALMVNFKGVGMECYVTAGKEFLAILELYKKEWREMNATWLALHGLVAAYDEIVLSKFRMRLKPENDCSEDAEAEAADVIVKSAIINEIPSSQLEMYHHSMCMDLQEHKRRLEKLLGTNSYLHSLHAHNVAGGTPDPCPICDNPLDRMYHVMLCGHTLCFTCLQALITQTETNQPESRQSHLAIRTINCPVCRYVQALPDINCVNGLVAQKDEVELKGNCSSKVASIIRLVLRLRSEDPDIKILIYSSWETVLRVMCENFTSNEIEYRLGQSHKNLKDFNSPNKGVTVLVLPLKFKTSGLNIITATHIIFADFPLDPAEELQAIGRIHRMGQNKETYTHKFYMKDTIEDALREYTNAKGHEGLNKTQLTMRHIKDLLFADGLQ